MTTLMPRPIVAAACLAIGAVTLGGGRAAADQVIPDDLLVQGSICIGIDCADGESFGLGTLRVKENNTRIDFIDTSTLAGFSTRDWRLEANASGSDAVNYFAIKDMGDTSTGAEGGTALLTLSAGAPENSLFVANTGRIGLRNAAPALDLHMTTGNTPAIRFEQTNASAFTPYTWDLGGHESFFFIRDVTGGSKLPFRIRPGAPTSSIDIAPTGFVGIGTGAPATNLHVVSTGTPRIAIESTAAKPSNWQFASSASTGTFSLNDATSGTAPLRIMQGAPTDSVTIAADGRITVSSLAGCTGGIKANANGILSCMSGAQSAANAVTHLNSPVATLASVPADRFHSDEGDASSASRSTDTKPRGSENAATCGDADLAGSWSLVGNAVDGSSTSVMWCDVQLSKAAGAYSIMGKCRSHSLADELPKSYDLRGERSISVTSACKLSGSFRIVTGKETITASIVEGRVQGEGKSRTVGVSRWHSGKTAALHTFVMQR